MDFLGKGLDFSTPKIMGILNITPDSFYDGGRNFSIEAALNRAETLVKEGADIIDVGGYSTRPGAAEVTVLEEVNRVVPVVEKISELFPEVLISVDTFRKTVAEKAIQAGANIVNDVSSGSLDDNMLNWILATKTPYIGMHMRGNPQTMQKLTDYSNVVADVCVELQEKFKDFPADFPLIIDPGFGFAKTLEQNYELLNGLEELLVLKRPVLVGVSRKSMIYKLLDCSAEESLNGTTAVNMIALMKGASILRVHDVKPALESIKIYLSTINHE